MRKVMLLYAPKANELVEKVNEMFMQAEKKGLEILKTEYVYADMDKYYCFLEYDTVIKK